VRDEWVTGGFDCTQCELAGRRWDLGCLGLIHLSWTSKGRLFSEVGRGSRDSWEDRRQLTS
jgi:hypothetical protein